MRAARLLNRLPDGCSHRLWGRWLNVSGHVLGLHGRALFIPPSCSASSSVAKALVLFMGGSADSRHKVMLNQVFKRYYAQYHNQQAIGYGTFHQVKTLMEYAKKGYEQGQKIILVGHSYGGYGAMSVTRQLNDLGIPVELLITLDPVACSIVIYDAVLGGPETARNWQPDQRLKEWINVYVDYDYIQQNPTQIGLANVVALKGGPLQSCVHAHTNMKLSLELLGHQSYLNDAHQWADTMFYETGLAQRVGGVGACYANYS
ncbi:DUF2235 domain-containing protein [Thiofilum flexile]|uniref:DUF2235 domain-containing protein n=1 Tax=Thiofilum flexile TaxID=125627 RepID=UPI00036DE3D3|nr:DUF2235 domain-containing protein [Thiofilum flexile]